VELIIKLFTLIIEKIDDYNICDKTQTFDKIYCCFLNK